MNEAATIERQRIAAALTTAVHTHILAMQLQGRTVSVAEALEEVRNTWELILRDEGLNQSLGAIPSTIDVLHLSETISRSETIPIASHAEQPTHAMLDGKYRILRELGSGGMGRVYLAEQLGTQRKTAVKFMHASTSEQTEKSVRYMRQEAAALARLNHPNIAQVYDAGTVGTGNDFYIAMEYVEGESLRSRMRPASPMPAYVVLEIMRQACTGLAAAHLAGIIHRDIKPENIMLTASGSTIKILDFGLAIVDKKDAESNLTGAGRFSGTAAYMSPEQVEALEVTPATDVYSLGIVAYELLTGRNPFVDPSFMQTCVNQVNMIPPPIRHFVENVPPHVEWPILKALEKDPSKRFRNADEFLHALKGFGGPYSEMLT